MKLQAIELHCDVCGLPIKKLDPHSHGALDTLLMSIGQRLRERRGRRDEAWRGSTDLFGRIAAFFPKEIER